MPCLNSDIYSISSKFLKDYINPPNSIMKFGMSEWIYLDMSSGSNNYFIIGLSESEIGVTCCKRALALVFNP